MIRIDYTFKAKTPLHTGSDTNMGTMRSLRRQKIALPEPCAFGTAFNDDQRRNAIVEILYAVHRAINWDAVKGKRVMGIWDEAYSKLLRAATTASKHQFFETLCRSWDVRSVSNNKVLDILETMTEAELLETVRSEAQYLILKLRRRTKQDMEPVLPVLPDRPEIKPESYARTFEMIPCISGNSIRGKLRRLAMHDFCKRAAITKLEKSTYHMLFTGGVLDESTRYEDIDKREQLIAMCPMLGVLGAAIGNMTIAGMLSVGIAYPVCRELQTGDQSYWEYLDTVFQTRYDSSKTEKEIHIQGETGAVSQMKYEYEVFCPGTPFNHGFAMLENDELCVSAFWHMLELFKVEPFICGMWAVGNSEIDLSELPDVDGRDDLYISYVSERKDEIADFFNIS